MKYALIGCGRISPNHIEAAKNNSVEIAAICDIVPDRMNIVAQTCNLPDSVIKYTDYKELIEQERPALVAIATESGTHFSVAAYCINHGCNVIIEKPIALSIEDADKLIELAKEKNVLLCVNHQNRFNKSIQYIRNAVESGRFGKLLHGSANILWNRNQAYYSAASWRGTWEQDGGVMMNQCIHNIDLLRWMMGNDIDEVFAYTDRLQHPYIEAEDFGSALIKFSNGSYGVIQGTANVFPKNLEETLYIFGENATVKAGGKSVNTIEEWSFADNLDNPDCVKSEYSEDVPNVYGYGHTPLYADMIDAIQTGRTPYVSGEDGKRALELVLAIYKSAKEGCPVKLPLTKCSALDFKGRFDDCKSLSNQL